MRLLSTIADWSAPADLPEALRSLDRSPPSAGDRGVFAGPCSVLGPRTEHSPDGHLVLTGDIRLDNREDLITELRQPPDSRPPTDAELVLAAYQRWGRHCAGKLVGDFAFALWDAQQAALYAARDGMNMRTLCYRRSGTRLYLASEARQLAQLPGDQPRLHRRALTAWISGHPDPCLSMFEGVEVLPPGHSLYATATTFETGRFWDIDPEYRIRYRRVEDYQEHLHELLQRAVGARLRNTAGRVATQMSGGMDSTTVAAIARQAMASSGHELVAVSHLYSQTQSCDESDKIELMRSHLGIAKLLTLDARDHAGLDYRELYPPALESPGTVLSPRYDAEMRLLQAAGAEVLLTGCGGDEMTWGHSLSYSHRLRRGDLTVIPEVFNSSRTLGLPPWRTLRQLFLSPLAPAWLRRALGRPPATNRPPPWLPVAAARQLDEARTPPGTRFRNPVLQARYDALRETSTINSVRSYARVAAGYGIEVRHPFFDIRVAEFSFAIPDHLWNRRGYPKWLLRRTMDGALPAAVCWNRHKVIFDSFFANLLRRQAPVIRTLLGDTRLQDLGLVDTGRLLAHFDQVMGGQQGFTVDLLYVLMVQTWLQRHGDHFTG
ncbi:MAG: asparagine synthetase B family protein [Parahaliea sp.]